MKNHVLCAFVGLILVTPFLFTQTKASTETKTVAAAPAPIPEEARKHFVMGTTLFKEAKTADDFAQVVSEFKRAADLASQWPDARYNLALAKEAAGDYPGAMADLKLYQKFTLSEEEARKVQDKIYALEAKAGAAARQKEQSAAEDKKKGAFQDMVQFLQGEWNYTGTPHFSSSFPSAISRSPFAGKAYINITDRTIRITTGQSPLTVKGTITGNDPSAIQWVLHSESESRWPDCPVNVTIDKTGPRIYWRRPWESMDMEGKNYIWNYSEYIEMELKR